MDLLLALYAHLKDLLPFLITVALVLGALRLAYWLLIRRNADLGVEDRTPRQVALVMLAIIGLAIVLLTLPMGSTTRDHLLSLLGIALTAVIALSSTTFAANAMAGLMLRIVKPYRPGDFVRIGDHFGRLTERGLFHTEIQTEDRDLTTLPNLYLVSNPLTVLRSSGTIVSTQFSLGYDIAHATVEPLLIEAAQDAGLQDPFVHITKLGDFSVTYRAAGFLPETKHLLSARSRLCRSVLDRLHGAGIEIVSPNFMNQRVLAPREPVIPTDAPADNTDDLTPPPEELIFDKADAAQRIEQLHARKAELNAEIKTLEAQASTAESADRSAIESRIAAMQRQADAIGLAASRAEEEKEADT